MTEEKNRPKSRQRLDSLLVERHLAADVREAAALVMAGKVVVNDQRAEKPGDMFRADAVIRVRNNGRYVSRGGDKLAGAVADFGLEGLFTGRTVLDVGSSTGGFTDFCLQRGAAHVIAVDVGTNQLAWELRTDARVTVLEQMDIRDFKPDSAPAADIVVGDISFISLERIAPAIVAAGGNAEHYILLVKPQFELSPDAVPAGGVVTDDADRDFAVKTAIEAFGHLGLVLAGSADCRLPGAAGNREVFIWLKKKPA
jgi:23S rRNA (cytidine1920-2'-O)/16S rRNA (cytidine1409-2'-O)-methyltransferase